MEGTYETDASSVASSAVAPVASAPTITLGIPITVRLASADARVVTEFYMQCDSNVWYHLAQYHWTVNDDGYCTCNNSISFHREAYKLIHNVQLASDQIVDHENRQRLCCLSSNLRLATPEENAQNRTKSTSREYTSAYYHVHWDNSRNMWRSEVETGRGGTRQRLVSYHDDEIQAAKASDLAAKRLHKAFASLNFP